MDNMKKSRVIVILLMLISAVMFDVILLEFIFGEEKSSMFLCQKSVLPPSWARE